jgi:hypothetical protein
MAFVGRAIFLAAFLLGFVLYATVKHVSRQARDGFELGGSLGRAADRSATRALKELLPGRLGWSRPATPGEAADE